MAEPHPKPPPYVYPDRVPSEYESDKRDAVWRVFGSVRTDGSGWSWGKCHAQDLVAGDIWVPIYTLRIVPLSDVVERSFELTSEDDRG